MTTRCHWLSSDSGCGALVVLEESAEPPLALLGLRHSNVAALLLFQHDSLTTPTSGSVSLSGCDRTTAQDSRPTPAAADSRRTTVLHTALVCVIVLLSAVADCPTAELVRQLKDPEPRSRRLAAEALGKQKAESAIPALTELLRDKDTPVRGASHHGAGEGRPEAGTGTG
jgi:HEAT repeats